MSNHAKEPRRTKIVCTLGPASSDEESLRRLMEAGMNVARINFSHGTAEEKHEIIKTVRRVADDCGRPVAILQDLQGPKIRVGTFVDGEVYLTAGAAFTITTRPIPGTAVEVSTTYPDLPRDLKKGDRFLLDDGLLMMEVLDKNETDVICEVIVGGRLSNHKGINLPGIRLSVPSLTKKDEEDLELGLAWGVDYIALSFVRTALDVINLKDRIHELGYDVPVIAKLEKPEAIRQLDEILRASDGVMVARGDLGVELPPEDVPVMQKRIISEANRLGRIVITATQMLESMIHNPRPTRAEASDVANAVFDGTDAVMLSAETSVGKYPVETVSMMDRICRRAESDLMSRDHYPARRYLECYEEVESAIALAAANGVDNLYVEGLAALTRGGRTALLCSKFRTRSYIWAFTPYEKIRRRMSLYWGVRPMVLEDAENIDELITNMEKLLIEKNLVAEEKLVAIVGGMPVGQSGTTNFLKFHPVNPKNRNI